MLDDNTVTITELLTRCGSGWISNDRELGSAGNCRPDAQQTRRLRSQYHSTWATNTRCYYLDYQEHKKNPHTLAG